MLRVAQRFLKAANSYEKTAIVQAKMRKKLLEILKQNSSSLSFGRVFEFGAGRDEFGKLLRKDIDFKEYISSDINDYALVFDDKRVRFLAHDMRLAMPDIKSFDLITSNACIQWLGLDIFAKLFGALNKNGVLLLSSFAPANLAQVRKMTGLGLDYPSVDEIFKALKSFDDVSIKSERVDLKFDSAISLFRHLKDSGVNSLASKFYISKSILERCEKEFDNTLSYEPIYIFARK